MEFACSHVVCNWKPDKGGVSRTENTYDNAAVKRQDGQSPPPLPPRRTRKPRPTSLPPPPPPSSRPPLAPLSLPPPVPPRGRLSSVSNKPEGENRLKANVNVVSLSIGKLVNINQATGMETFEKPVVCGKCNATLSCLSSIQKNVWACEFCGCENSVDGALKQVCIGQRVGVRSDDIYLPNQSDDDYQNLEDTVVVFCVDISGSMCVTTEVPTSSGQPTYISRLEGIQDALQRALSSMLKESPHRRVALVTFSDEVVIYGDGTSTPLPLRDWALIDYDHIWEQGMSYSIPHCIAETYQHLIARVKELREHGATCLGPAALASVAIASRYPGSKVILCTDGRANIGLGELEHDQPYINSSTNTPHFYRQLALQAVASGVIISVMGFKGTDCCLVDIGKLADATGGRVNIVSIGTIATEIQLASIDNVLATGVSATLLASEGIYFPYDNENNHKLTIEIGNVTKGLEITFQFVVKPEFMKAFLQRDTLPFQLQLRFKTRDQQNVTRIITERRPVTSSSRIWTSSFNMDVLGVHCAQLCASLTMEGRVQEAQKYLKAQQDLLEQISQHRSVQNQDSIYSNWMETMTSICDDITTESNTLSDEAANVVYQMRRASSTINTTETPKRPPRQKKKALVEGM